MKHSRERLSERSINALRTFTLLQLVVAMQTVAIAPPNIFIGGLFNAFNVGTKGTILRNEKECQHLAAFMLAIDEINDKHDGRFDTIMNGTQVKISLNLGQDYVRTYPPNSYFDGASSVYLGNARYSSMVGLIETDNLLPQAMSVSSTSNAFGLLSMLSTSKSSVFKDSSTYPMTLQISATSFSEALVLGKLLTRRYKYNKQAVFISGDISNIDSFTGFISNAANVIGEFVIIPGQIDFTAHIDKAKSCGATIFVLFMGGIEAGRLLEQGYNAGLFHEGTQVFTTSTSNIVDMRSSFTANGLANEANILRGLISTAPFPERYFSTPNGQSFITRFRNLPPTITIDPITKKQICNKRTDGNRFVSYIYRATAVFGIKGVVNESLLCLGFQSFKDFNQNGSNIDPNILFSYDFVYSYALAVNAVISAKLADPSIVLKGPEIYAYMTARTTSFPDLSTGNVSFAPNRGFRNYGNIFKILNYQGSGNLNQYSEGSLVYAGEYTDSSGWLLCGSSTDMALMPTMSSKQCSNLQYRTASGSIPPNDEPSPIVAQLPSNLSGLLIALATIGMISLAVWGSCLYAFWQAKQIRTSQPRIMVFLLIGGVLGLIRVYLAAFPVTHTSCVGQLWLSHLAFRLIFRTLLLKLWRIHAVMNAGSFKRIVIGENTVVWYLLSDIAALTVVFLIPITIISSLGNGLAGYVASTTNNQTTLFAECQVSTSLAVAILNGMLYASDALYLLMAVYYTYKTRAVPASVNETSTVGPG